MNTLSVLTLTCNRLAKLRAMLERLLPQLAEGDEIVILDTGSDDGTREFFGAWSHPRVRFLMVDRASGSWAELRNRLVREAGGEFLAFLDDDCLPAVDWVERGRAALANADAVGGIAQPLGITAWPRWWHPEMAWMVGLGVPGQVGPDAGRVHYPSTSNLWVRAAAARALTFQELGGALGGEERERYALGREDAQWWRQLRTRGWRTRFDPELVVQHAIDPARLSLAYLDRRARLDGVAWARREGTAQDVGPLAYQWWRQWAAGIAALGEPAATRDGARQLHRLTMRRHGAALTALAAHIAHRGDRMPKMILAPRLIREGMRLASDRGKARARAIMRPWLAARPIQPTAPVVQRIAVMAFGFLGDLVILQSALRGLMERYPRVEVYVLAPSAGAVVLGGVKRLNVTVTPEDPNKTQPRGRARWMEDWLRRLDPDAIIAPYLHGPWGSALMKLTRPPRPIVGFDCDNSLPRAWMTERLGVRVHRRMDLHESLNICALLGAAGLECAPLPAVLQADEDALARARAHLGIREGAALRTWIMFNPSAGYPAKEWDAEAWSKLMQGVLANPLHGIVVNAFQNREELQAIVASHVDRDAMEGGRVVWLGGPGLEDFVATLRLCRAIVTPDTGPQHLAHALGVPSVALYGQTDERRWGDYWQRPENLVVRACAMDLTHEEKRGLEPNHQVAMIDGQWVLSRLHALLAGFPAPVAP